MKRGEWKVPMDATFTALLVTIEVIVLAAEAVLWFAFRAKAVPISFPHETDASSLRSFTFARLRVIVLVHTILLAVLIALIFFFLW